MFCPNCGNQLDDSARFCANCGNAIGGTPAPKKAASSFDFQALINKITSDKKALVLAILAVVHLIQLIMLFCPVVSHNYGYGMSVSTSLFKMTSTLYGIVLIIMMAGGCALTTLRLLDVKLGCFNVALAQKINSVVICALLSQTLLGISGMAFCGWLNLIVSLPGLVLAAHQFIQEKEQK